MPQQTFVGAHTVLKLDALEAYLKAFLTAFKNKAWAHTIYFDAFAGTGELPTKMHGDELQLGDDERKLIQGSAKRALALELPFGEYVFVEKSRGKARELEARLKSEHSARSDRIRVLNDDANEALRALCTTRDWKVTRAVVFLDPFGSQVDWHTLEMLGRTKAIDLWYLFPAGLSVSRQIGNKGTVHKTHEEALDRILGTSEWRQRFLEQRSAVPDLFGEASGVNEKTATPESVTEFMRERLDRAFAGGASADWLRLGRNQAHWYSLMFACANPSPKAKQLAHRLARAVIRSKQRGRTK